jgi:LmbE family N-acetylglucosaminyl deacetylase
MITRRQALLSVLSGALARAQGPAVSPGKLRIIAIGAHPDDCDIKFGGTAAKFAAGGHAVKFLSVTNGDAGHQEIGGARLAQRRFLEAQESARRLGIHEYEILDNHDGELMPTLEVRRQIVRAIRKWKAELVFAPRPNDYHPDHRYTGVLVQDAAYMVVVPNVVADTAPLDRNPIFLYYEDGFEKPAPFRADVIVPIDDVYEKKVNALDAHVSQFYEWLPWVDRRLDEVPKDPAARRKWLAGFRQRRTQHPGVPAGVNQYEAFELCEYGRRPPLDELRKMFPLK